MAWYLRKSLNFGPLRINFSKSGLGGSVGVKGLRVGTGPGGRYLHAGRGGLYYRTRLDAPSRASAPASEPEDSHLQSAADQPEVDPAPTPIDPATAGPGQNQLGMRLFRSLLNGLRGSWRRGD